MRIEKKVISPVSGVVRLKRLRIFYGFSLRTLDPLNFRTCKSAFERIQALREGMKKLEAMTLEGNGLQYILRKNGFSHLHRSGSMGFREIKYIVRFRAPESKNSHGSKVESFEILAEIEMAYAPLLQIKKAMQIEYRVERGDFDSLSRAELDQRTALFLQAQEL